MKIIGFPIDVSRSQDGRIVRGLRTRQSLVQATLDLVRGLGLANTISDDTRRRVRILDTWADTVDRVLKGQS